MLNFPNLSIDYDDVFRNYFTSLKIHRKLIKIARISANKSLCNGRIPWGWDTPVRISDY